MAKASKRIGVLTAGGDSPGLNAAIRGLGKAAIGRHNMELIGFRDGVRGLAENRFVDLGPSVLSGILTVGGTILGTSRDKVHKMMVDREPVDIGRVGAASAFTASVAANAEGKVRPHDHSYFPRRIEWTPPTP